jgi:hypothetical protein
VKPALGDTLLLLLLLLLTTTTMMVDKTFQSSVLEFFFAALYESNLHLSYRIEGIMKMLD